MGIEGIDNVMSYGFNWAAPSLIMEMLGGEGAVTELLDKKGMVIPEAINAGLKSRFSIINSGKYFVAK
jgi:hypothetical protein